MKVTNQGSMKIYRELANSATMAPKVMQKKRKKSPYLIDGNDRVVIVRTDDRKKGIIEAIKKLGGLGPITEDINGEVIIKPNCNTDDVYPRDSHPDTIRAIANELINSGISPSRVVVGDMSGRARGLPTKATMENLGIKSVADDIGFQLSYFEEEPWVRVEIPEADFWPDGITIPERVYNAERIIFTPILRSHSTATFTCALKLGVGLIDAASRDWLHNGEWHHEKIVQMNLAWNVDLVISDVMEMNTGYGTEPSDNVKPGIIIASNSMIANDCAAVALMRYYDTVRLRDMQTRKHRQISLAKKYGLGCSDLSGIKIKTSNLEGDNYFEDIITWIEGELKD